jgi:hypothetical protein
MAANRLLDKDQKFPVNGHSCWLASLTLRTQTSLQRARDYLGGGGTADEW